MRHNPRQNLSNLLLAFAIGMLFTLVVGLAVSRKLGLTGRAHVQATQAAEARCLGVLAQDWGR